MEGNKDLKRKKTLRETGSEQQLETHTNQPLATHTTQITSHHLARSAIRKLKSSRKNNATLLPETSPQTDGNITKKDKGKRSLDEDPNIQSSSNTIQTYQTHQKQRFHNAKKKKLDSTIKKLKSTLLITDSTPSLIVKTYNDNSTQYDLTVTKKQLLFNEIATGDEMFKKLIDSNLETNDPSSFMYINLLRQQIQSLQNQVLRSAHDARAIKLIANENDKKLVEGITCSICYDFFAIPHTVGCGHSFCFQCLYQWALKLAQEQSEVKCPCCRVVLVTRPIQSVVLSQQVEVLLTNIQQVVSSLFEDNLEKKLELKARLAEHLGLLNF
jgi:hypothetical protein